MKAMKMLGLAMVAAMAAMALIGASSASANNTSVVLCKTAELTCAAGNQYANPTTLLGVAANPFLVTSIGTIKCDTSHAAAEVLNTLSTSVVAHVTALSFTGNCNLNGTPCTVTVVSNGLLNVTRLGPLTANAKSTGGTKALVECGELIHCVYGGEPTLTATSTNGGTAATLTAEGAELARLSGLFCPKTSLWTAVYKLTSPATAVYIES